jgi:hypothetical protein
MDPGNPPEYAEIAANSNNAVKVILFIYKEYELIHTGN